MIDYTLAATLALDGMLIGLGILNVMVVWKVLRVRSSGPVIVASFGLLMLSSAHLSETILDLFFGFVGHGAPELLHRVLVLSAFLCLVYGLSRLGRELWRERQRVLLANAELIEVQEELRLSNEELRERNRQLLGAYARVAKGVQRQPIRVMIADPDPNVRRIMMTLLADESEVEVVGEAANEPDAVAAAEKLCPDVLLMDAALANPDCIATFKSMKEPAQIIVLGTYREAALNALASRACDYVLKDAGRSGLLEAIRRAVPAYPESEVENQTLGGGVS